MTQPPSAADLGVSDAVYERILRDVARRQGAAPQPASPAPTPRRRRRGPWRSLLVVSVAVLVTLLAVPLLTERGGLAGGEGSYAFLATDGENPVTYTSCRQIQIAVYPLGGPSDAEGLVREAVQTVRAATGLDLVVVGAFGGAAPNWNFQAAPVSPDDPISISWQDGAAIAELTDEVAGLGGSRTLTNPDGSKRFVAGTVALSRDYFRTLEESGRRDLGRAVLLHELGHVLGLAHVDDPGELMNAGNLGRTTFGPGDLEGLRQVGRGRCF